jgi:hypothetical protein
MARLRVLAVRALVIACSDWATPVDGRTTLGATTHTPKPCNGILLAFGLLALMLATQGCSDSNSRCSVGTEGCACTTGGTCAAGLDCRSQLCVCESEAVCGGTTAGMPSGAVETGDGGTAGAGSSGAASSSDSFNSRCKRTDSYGGQYSYSLGLGCGNCPTGWICSNDWCAMPCSIDADCDCPDWTGFECVDYLDFSRPVCRPP